MIRCLIFSALLPIISSQAADLVLESGPKQTALMELYTSEGCSSCPPAEAWLSTWKTNPQLWRDVVPVAFHVDYWDGLGWPDRFASKNYTDRQRAFAAEWRAGTVYTPGFVLNGLEWQSRSKIATSSNDAGLLKAVLDDQRHLRVTYAGKKSTNLIVHVALLGFDLVTNVRAGENSGRNLAHDFVVLSWKSQPLVSGAADWTLDAPLPGEKALAVWVSEGGNNAPLQALGGWLQPVRGS